MMRHLSGHEALALQQRHAGMQARRAILEFLDRTPGPVLVSDLAVRLSLPRKAVRVWRLA